MTLVSPTKSSISSLHDTTHEQGIEEGVNHGTEVAWYEVALGATSCSLSVGLTSRRRHMGYVVHGRSHAYYRHVQ